MKFISRHGMNKIFKVNDETDEPIEGAKSHAELCGGDGVGSKKRQLFR